MINRVTSATVFQDAVGMRLSMTYSVIDEQTGRVQSDNNRLNRIITNAEALAAANAVIAHAQDFVDDEES